MRQTTAKLYMALHILQPHNDAPARLQILDLQWPVDALWGHPSSRCFATARGYQRYASRVEQTPAAVADDSLPPIVGAEMLRDHGPTISARKGTLLPVLRKLCSDSSFKAKPTE